MNLSDSDFIRIAAAYRRAELRTAEQFRNIWTRGTTNPDLVQVDFCAADFILANLEVSPS